MIDIASAKPLYIQVEEQCIELIKNKTWAVGIKIPTEAQLCKQFGVSRITVRQAMTKLAERGLISKKQGLGTFVCKPKITQRLHDMYSFSEELKKQGYSVSNDIISFEIISSDEYTAKQLEIKADDLVYELKRLRFADEEPYALEASYIPYDLIPELDINDIKRKGLYNTLTEVGGIVIDNANESFEAVILSKEAGGLLKAGEGFPALRLERVTRSGNTIYEYCESYVRGDRYKYTIKLNSQRND